MPTFRFLTTPLAMALAAIATAAAVTAAAGTASAGEAPAATAAPLQVEVGDPSVQGAFLQPYTNQWTFTIQQPGQAAVEAGIWTDALEAITFAGRPALKRTQVANYTKKNFKLIFINIFDPKTMEPLQSDYERTDSGEKRHIDFRHETVTYRRTPGAAGAAPEEKTATLARRVFDFYDGTYGLLLSAFPLRKGYTVSIPTFDTTTMAVDWVPVRVIGRETVAAGKDKRVATWVVETPTRLYGKMTWWLSREPPYVIQALVEVPLTEDGSSTAISATIRYTMTG
jgi:hypothetical protein